MPRFQTISHLFTVDGSGPYLGQAIASDEAIYLVTELEPLNLTSLFTGRIMQKLTGDSGPFLMRLSDLPEAVTGDSTWPVETKDGFVCVFDRQSISKIRCALSGKIRITNQNQTAVMKTGVIRRFLVLRTLREFGWNV